LVSPTKIILTASIQQTKSFYKLISHIHLFQSIWKGFCMLISPYPFVQTRTLREHFELGKFAETRLRSQLPSPIYWIQPERKILWNLVLVKDWLINGSGDSHNRLVEEYLLSLSPIKKSHSKSLKKVAA
jgi:hypothetical protein